MIRICRPRRAPDILSVTGAKRTREDCEKYDCDPKNYIGGAPFFKFVRDIYSHSAVKSYLCSVQSGKCCYCESVVMEYGAVEHFRPKSSVRQGPGEPRIRPGYYWLAYKWDNLLFVCGVCNTNKSDLFPLKDPSHRAYSHHDNIMEEEPILIDPSSNDPRQHIRFRRDAPVAITCRGRETIALLKLDAEKLSEERRLWLEILDTSVKILKIFGSNPTTENEPNDREVEEVTARARKLIDTATLPSSRFSSMAIDFL